VRVLQINKFLWRSGGAEGYMFDLASLLESRGHEVIYFSMEDARNRPCAQSKYFVSHLDYRGLSLAGGLRNASRIVGGTVYSFEAREKLGRLLADLKPDVAHLHLIDHHLSPSVLHALRDAGVPAVMTAHDYKLICPNYQLYVPRRREICGRCVPGKYYRCVARRCMKDSIAASALAASAMYIHRGMNIYGDVAAFLYATEFVRDRLIDGGVDASRLVRAPLYIDLPRFTPRGTPEDYIAYAGRLSPEKGLSTLLRAMKNVPNARLAIIGDGPERGVLESQARELGLAGVEFCGHLDGAAYADKLAGARLLVLPSEWYETCGLVTWEAHALARPVVASRIGGIPESVIDEENGLLFEPGNATDLAAKISHLLDRPDEARAMGEAGRRRVEAQCAAHYERIIAVYTRAIAERAA
jgi:glycosyltransferase involved in cell wall biosynthesis